MSRAISAKTARERATILAALIRRGVSHESRELSNCLEMGDGEEVMRLIRQRITKGTLPYTQARKYLTAESLRGSLPDVTGAHVTYSGRLFDVTASTDETLTLRTFDRSQTITAKRDECAILERTYQEISA